MIWWRRWVLTSDRWRLPYCAWLATDLSPCSLYTRGTFASLIQTKQALHISLIMMLRFYTFNSFNRYHIQRWMGGCFRSKYCMHVPCWSSGDMCSFQSYLSTSGPPLSRHCTTKSSMSFFSMRSLTSCNRSTLTALTDTQYMCTGSSHCMSSCNESPGS